MNMTMLARARTLFALAAVFVSAGCAGPPAARPVDYLIVNARIADGSGGAIVGGAVRVRGDRIADVGQLKPQQGETVIDAAGQVLAPGFIDTHSHHDYGLDKNRAALPIITQGVTTIIVGQDGGSAAPIREVYRRYTAHPAAVNLASYSGHNSLRADALGENYKRQATPAEIERMRVRLADDMAAGALGLSTGLEYDPGIYSASGEVVTLAKEAARHGGRYISHMRSEDRNVWQALDELIAIGREAHIPVQVSHAKLAMTDWWGQGARFVAKLDAARAAGVEASADIYPYTSWQSGLSVLWPERDFGNRKTAEFVLDHLAPADGLIVTGYDADPSLIGKSIAQIAADRRTDAVTTAMDLLRESEAKKSPIGVMGRSMDERDIATIMAWPFTNICSDGGLDDRHPRGAGSFTRVLRYYVREQKILSLGEAIRKMTSLAAQNVGIADRGAIKVGYFADLILFDPDTVGDRSTIADPGALSTGISKAWVNGTLVYANGKGTGAYPGRAVARARTTAW